MTISLSNNVTSLSHLDIAGGGQIIVDGDYLFIGHMKPPHGTTIVDIADPANPKIVCEIDSISRWSHTHKVRVAGNIMITNVEQNQRHQLRRGERIPQAIEEFNKLHGHKPNEEELATAMGIGQSDLTDIRAFQARGYDEGGFRVWDISNRSKPRQLSHVRTSGFGVHRFDMDQRYAYISTEMQGFVGNILVIFDLSDPEHPEEVSRWWMPGQHLAGGETPTWSGYGHRLHHAMRVGNELWAAVWHAGFRVIDISDISRPQTSASYSYHPWVVEPTHTVMPAAQLYDNKRVAVVCDEEHSHRHGQPHAGLWLFDVTDLNNITPLSTFHVSELDSPWSRTPGGRFGMHQFQEHIDDHLVYCAWFAGGLRIVDISDPGWPKEVGHYIPQPPKGHTSPQSNDVEVDARGLIYVLDRNRGVDILQYAPHS